MEQQHCKILVVDDEPGIRKSCSKILEPEGYIVETTADGLAGFEMFKNNADFAAALIDLKMPKIDGIELIKKIRCIDKNISLFVITAYATIETAVEATKCGANDYITKPFTPDELLLPLKNGLEKRALTLEAQRLREEQEERLLEIAYERSRSATIINCMSDAVIVVNLDKQIVLINAAARTILPWESPPNLPCPLSSLDCMELRNLLCKTLQTLSQQSIVSKEISLSTSTYLANTSPVIDSQGSVRGGVAVFRDITALKELSVAKSTFMSMVAHELKSPLGAIEGYLDLVLDKQLGGDPLKNRKMLERSLLRATALRKLVDELMSLRAMETGHFSIERSPIDVIDVLKRVISTCSEKADKKKIEIAANFDKTSDIPNILADAHAMQTIFTNLIENAIKYTPEGGHIRIEARTDPHDIIVSVGDDGIGMKIHEQEKIFEEFFRVKNRFTSGIPGTGLGLSIVKNYLDMHHGRISVQSTSGKGSVFTVSIPLIIKTNGI